MDRRLSDHYDQVKSALFSVVICLLITIGVCAEESSQQNELKIIGHKYSQYGMNLGITKEELLDNLPPKLGEYSVQGKIKYYTKYRAQLYPLSDLEGVRIDSINNMPAYILVLFDEMGQSQLVLLKNSENNYLKIWEGPICVGIGYVDFEDINNDAIPEIITKLALDSHGYGNVFYYTTGADSLRPLHEGAIDGGISEFCGYVNLVKSDSGTAISAYHPDDKFSKEYFIQTKRNQLILKKKTPIDQLNK